MIQLRVPEGFMLVHTIRLLCLSVLVSSAAFAGSGPWVVGEGHHSLYLGLQSQRLTKLSLQLPGGTEVMDVGTGLSTFSGQAVTTIGVSRFIELESAIPYGVGRVHDTESAFCDFIGPSRCEPTQGVGIVQTRLKAMFADQYSGAPIAAAVGLESRFGLTTFDHRDRITNLGEGSLDAAIFLSGGRTSTLGATGYVSVYSEVAARYRLPLNNNFGPGTNAPAHELQWSIQSLVAPGSGHTAVGATADLLKRFGTEFDLAYSGSPEWLSGYDLTTVAIGIKALHQVGNTTIVTSVQKVVFARNNPSDTLTFNIGAGWYDPFKKKTEL